MKKLDFEHVLAKKKLEAVKLTEENAVDIARHFHMSIIFVGDTLFLQPRDSAAIRVGSWIDEAGRPVEILSEDMDRESLLGRFPIWTSDKAPDLLGIATDSGNYLWILDTHGNMELCSASDISLSPSSEKEMFALWCGKNLNLRM